MIDLSDLGLEPVSSAATTASAIVAAPAPKTKGLVPGSLNARLLYSVCSRQRITVVDSPPGSGKTTLVVDAIETLLDRTEFKIIVACPTRRGALDLAERLVAVIGTGKDRPAVVCSIKNADLPTGVYANKPQTRERYVTIRTIASCSYSPPDCDVMIFDEAYQTTYATMASAADGADQIVMVGDPGQIGPVVTQNTSAWERKVSAPHRRAPEVFAARADAVVLQMDATYRLGQDTVDAIAPLYGFEFESRRPDRVLRDRAGVASPELAHEIVPVTTDPADLPMLHRVADLAVSMIGRTVTTTLADGTEETVTLGERDVAVVVSRNAQSSTISAMLRSMVREGIAVGTADKMQGGQWHAVIALDPLVGEPSVGSHQLNLGRLCVMASRHMTHLTWVTDSVWEQKLRAAADETPDAKVGIAVRRHLTR